MSVHILKCWPGGFGAILDGTKKFEYRRDDRGFLLGDILLLKEWNHSACRDTGRYTGRRVEVRVTHLLRGMHGVPEGFVVMSIEPVVPEAARR